MAEFQDKITDWKYWEVLAEFQGRVILAVQFYERRTKNDTVLAVL